LHGYHPERQSDSRADDQTNSGESGVRRLSTIIVDDDPGARDQLRELCRSRSELQVVAECSGAEEARDVILTRQPDVAFLAVEMHTTTGLQLVRELPESTTPRIVFVSAYDRYAVQAFDLNAVDYVLKPVEQSRFRETIQRVLARVRAYESDDRRKRLVTSVDGSSIDVAQPRWESGPHRLIIQIGDRVHFVELAEIESIEADRNYVWINTRTTYRVRASLKEVERLLPPDRFVRVNRSMIVNARCITSIERLTHGEYSIHLLGGGVVTTGRRFRALIPGAILRRQT
jgi:two-component system, LytTR family, response regulator